MMYPLVGELTVDGIPVTVSCRVLVLARAEPDRWLQNPFTDTQPNESLKPGTPSHDDRVKRDFTAQVPAHDHRGWPRHGSRPQRPPRR